MIVNVTLEKAEDVEVRAENQSESTGRNKLIVKKGG